jgi:hypothetical protein
MRKGKKWVRVEENSEVQKRGKKCVRCGEMNSGMGCGDGPARRRGGSLVVLLLAERAR